MPTSLAIGEYRDAQVVWTYLPDRWPAGLITGHVDAEQRFHVAHVHAYRPRVLLAMLRAGIAECRARGHVAICITIPTDFPPASGLLLVARRLGFDLYATRPDFYDVVKWLA